MPISVRTLAQDGGKGLVKLLGHLDLDRNDRDAGRKRRATKLIQHPPRPEECCTGNAWRELLQQLKTVPVKFWSGCPRHAGQIAVGPREASNLTVGDRSDRVDFMPGFDPQLTSGQALCRDAAIPEH